MMTKVYCDECGKELESIDGYSCFSLHKEETNIDTGASYLYVKLDVYRPSGEVIINYDVCITCKKDLFDKATKQTIL